MSWRRLTPVELGDQAVPLGVLRVADQVEVGVVFLEGDGVALTQGVRHLSVDDGCGALVGSGGGDLDFAVALDHQRAVGQRVRRQRGQDDGLDAGLDDGAAGGEVVPGRARRRADDEPVARDLGQVPPVDGDGQGDHSKRRAGLYHAVVDAQALEAGGVQPADGGLDDHPLVDQGVVADHLLELGLQLSHGELSQESEFAEVDPDERHLPIGQRTGDTQQRSVAAQHDDLTRPGLQGDLPRWFWTVES